jgi:hypothetical protein
MSTEASRKSSVLYPPGSKVRITKDSSGLSPAELYDTYTVVEVKTCGDLSLRDSLGVRFCYRVGDCSHPGVDLVWLYQNIATFEKGSVVRRLMRCFAGKRFLRLRSSIRDRILTADPDLKQRILSLLATLKS